MMKIIPSLLAAISILILSGCSITEQTTMFGLRTVAPLKSQLNITSYSEESGVKYTYGKTESRDVYAYGYAFPEGQAITIKIHNRSDDFISTNYFSDQFTALDKQGRTHSLEKAQITNYALNEVGIKKNVINPGEYLSFRVFLQGNTRIEDIEKIVCIIGMSDPVAVELHMIPRMDQE